MSITISASITCDTCGDVVAGEDQSRTTHAVLAISTAKLAAKHDGWLTIDRGRYYTQTHYCPKCADRPMAPKGRTANDERA